MTTVVNARTPHPEVNAPPRRSSSDSSVTPLFGASPAVGSAVYLLRGLP
ncbi:MAG TPA: hypothetical protein VGB98_27015 [Pyrinomonadaceae bacterium]|jgi:hypothetical protein